jgi:hypothetical protein
MLELSAQPLVVDRNRVPELRAVVIYSNAAEAQLGMVLTLRDSGAVEESKSSGKCCHHKRVGARRTPWARGAGASHTTKHSPSTSDSSAQRRWRSNAAFCNAAAQLYPVRRASTSMGHETPEPADEKEGS